MQTNNRDWQVAIDIKIWESDFFMLEKILSYAKAKPWLKVLFAEDFSEVISMNHPNSWMIYNILSGIHIESYDKKPIDCHMSLSPNILEGLNDEEKIETEDVAYQDGVKLVARQFADALKRLGLEEIDAVGTRFDPEFHEAVSHIDDPEKGEQEIVQEYRKGYRIGNKVVRHSMVIVAN